MSGSGAVTRLVAIGAQDVVSRGDETHFDIKKKI